MEEENIKVSQKEYFNFMAHKITHDVVEQVDKKLDVMNQRIEKLDSKIDNVKTDLTNKIDSNFKWLAGIMVAGILVPIALHFIK